jgi:DMSO/TMAO reductase YedYZ heme-binding membrane subunit
VGGALLTLATVNLVWDVTRAGGFVGFALLTVSVVLGLLLSARLGGSRWPRFALEDLHRSATLLAGCFVGLHVLVLLADDFVSFSLVDLAVPGSAGYRPVATALGTVAVELLAALAVANLLRRRLGHRVWRRAHYLSFGVWLLALVHAILAGSDASSLPAVAFYGVSAAGVAGLAAWRLATALRPPAPRVSTALPAGASRTGEVGLSGRSE